MLVTEALEFLQVVVEGLGVVDDPPSDRTNEVFQYGHRSGDRSRGHNTQGTRAVGGGVRILNPPAQGVAEKQVVAFVGWAR